MIHYEVHNFFEVIMPVLLFLPFFVILSNSFLHLPTLLLPARTVSSHRVLDLSVPDGMRKINS